MGQHRIVDRRHWPDIAEACTSRVSRRCNKWGRRWARVAEGAEDNAMPVYCSQSSRTTRRVLSSPRSAQPPQPGGHRCWRPAPAGLRRRGSPSRRAAAGRGRERARGRARAPGTQGGGSARARARARARGCGAYGGQRRSWRNERRRRGRRRWWRHGHVGAGGSLGDLDHTLQARRDPLVLRERRKHVRCGQRRTSRQPFARAREQASTF